MSGTPQPESLLAALLDEVEKTDAPAPPAAENPARPAAGSAPPPGTPPAGAPPSDLLGALPALMRVIGQPDRDAPHHADRHTALLRALRPYLSPARRSAVDTLLTLSGVWDTLAGMGLRLPLPGVPQAGAAPDGSPAPETVRTAQPPADGIAPRQRETGGEE